jgi:membrane protein YqaA with SNARE-associated domain
MGTRGEHRVATYDPALLYAYADQLYRSAKWLEVVFTIVGLIGGAITGYSLGTLLLIGRAAGANVQVPMLLLAGTGALLGSILGWMGGRQMADRLRLQAQLTLCQVQIEVNTRR